MISMDLMVWGIVIVFIFLLWLANKIKPRRQMSEEELMEYRKERARLRAREHVNEKLAKKEGRWSMGGYDRPY